MKICSITDCGNKHYALGYCTKHYWRWKRNGDANYLDRFRGNPQESFEARTMPVTETGCLLWEGAANKNGYGLISVEGKMVSTPTFAWEQEHGKVPNGLELDHKCHTPACCNPEHLRLATRAQNTWNKSGLRLDNTSGHRNVSWDKKSQKWRVKVSGKHYGLFLDIEEAARVADEKRKELFGEFAGRG